MSSRRQRELLLRAQHIVKLRKLEWKFETNPTRTVANELAMLRDEIRMSEDRIISLNESGVKLAKFQAMCDE